MCGTGSEKVTFINDLHRDSCFFEKKISEEKCTRFSANIFARNFSKRIKNAAQKAYEEHDRYLENIRKRGMNASPSRSSSRPIIVLKRPPLYHRTPEITHGIHRLITS